MQYKKKLSDLSLHNSRERCFFSHETTCDRTRLAFESVYFRFCPCRKSGKVGSYPPNPVSVTNQAELFYFQSKVEGFCAIYGQLSSFFISPTCLSCSKKQVKGQQLRVLSLKLTMCSMRDVEENKHIARGSMCIPQFPIVILEKGKQIGSKSFFGTFLRRVVSRRGAPSTRESTNL